jgi:hypothetical protein
VDVGAESPRPVVLVLGNDTGCYHHFLPGLSLGTATLRVAWNFEILRNSDQGSSSFENGVDQCAIL